MKALGVVVMLVAFTVVSVRAEEPPTASGSDAGEISEGQALLAEVRALVERGEWQAAKVMLEVHPGSFSEPTDFMWEHLRSYLEAAVISHGHTEWKELQRAKSATLLRLHDLAMQQYDKLIVIASDNQQLYDARSGKALSAWAAAQVAVRRGEYEVASRYLDIMMEFGEGWIIEEATRNADLIHILLADPDSIPNRIAFAASFWIEMAPVLGKDYVEARKILIDSLALTPTPEARLQLYQLIQQYSIAIPDIPTAIDYTERICADFPEQADVCDRALFALAQHYTDQKEPRKAIETLESILALHPQSTMTGTVHLGLSEAHASVDDEEGMLKYLELAAMLPAEASGRGIMDTSDTRQVAVVRLGKYYQNKKDFDKALEYFQSWEPRSWCGNCQAQFAYEKDLYIAQCLISLGHADEALTEHLLPQLRKDEISLYSDAKIPELVVRLYEDKRDLDGLIRIMQPHAASEHNITAQIALGLAQIRIERRDGKIPALVARLRHSGSFIPSIREPRDNWEAPAAAQALSEFNGAEYPALREVYDSLLAQEDQEKAHERKIWVLYAIALSHAPEARVFLDALLAKMEAEEQSNLIGLRINDIRFLVALAEERSHEASESTMH